MSGLFGHLWRLLLVLAVFPAFAVFAARFGRLKKTLLPLVSRVAEGNVRALSRLLWNRSVLLAASWVLLVCAWAEPRWGSELVSTRQEGSSVMFVIDVSRSMTVTDVAPSRLVFASGFASMLAGAMTDARCGVVLAKGDAVLAIPLTSDHRAVSDLLDTVSPAMLSAPGSNPGRGVAVALASFPEASTASRTIIVLTDGDETGGSLEEAASGVGASGANLVIVGIGTRAGAPLNANPGAEEPEMMVMALHDETLRKAVKIAGRGSVYVNGTDTGSAKQVLAAVEPDAGKKQKLVYSAKPVPRYPVFLCIALALFCAGCMTGGLTWRKKR